MFFQEKINYSARDYDVSHFANILYSTRMELGMSQAEFSNLIEVSAPTYCRHESGNIKRISAYVVDNFSQKFNIPKENLLIPRTDEGQFKALYEWSKKPEAIPYMQEAYDKWLSDRKAEIQRKFG